MALIKYGPAIADARGSVGGTVFSRNGSGAYMKQRTTPTYSATPKQTTQANIFAAVVSDWRNVLTIAQRLTWADLAVATTLRNKLGESFSPSGMQLFVRANNLLEITGQAHVAVAPNNAVAPAAPLTLVYAIGTGIDITAIDGFDDASAGFLLVRHSGPVGLTRNYWTGPYPYSMLVEYTDLAALPELLLATAGLQADSRYFFAIRGADDDGAVTHTARYQVDVDAVA